MRKLCVEPSAGKSMKKNNIMHEIWLHLVDKQSCPWDADAAHKFFYEPLVRNSSAIQPRDLKKFYQKYILKQDPATISEAAMQCFEATFREMNYGQASKQASKDEELMGYVRCL